MVEFIFVFTIDKECSISQNIYFQRHNPLNLRLKK